MILDHTATTANLQQKYTTSRLFFASQRNYGYALAQENSPAGRVFSLQTLTEAPA